MKSNKLLILFLVLFGIAIFSAGCPAPERRPAPPPPNTQDRLQNEEAEVNPLEDMILSMPEVEDVWMVLSGNTAYIAIDLKANIDDQRISEVKNEIAQKVKSAQGAPNEITNVFLTADPDLTTRIRQVSEGLAEGRPLTSFTKEMSEITRRLNPTNR